MHKATAVHNAPVDSPTRQPGSPGRWPLAVCTAASRDRDLFRQEGDAARLAADTASRLKEELDVVKRQRTELQDKLLEAERQRAGLEARLKVLQRSKDLKPTQAGAGARSPSQSNAVRAAPAFTGQSLQFLASELLEYAHLATRLMADARSSSQQLGTIGALARTSKISDLDLDGLTKVDGEVATRLHSADRRYRPDVVAAAQQPGCMGPWGINAP